MHNCTKDKKGTYYERRSTTEGGADVKLASCQYLPEEAAAAANYECVYITKKNTNRTAQL